jgi:hypothetical protein
VFDRATTDLRSVLVRGKRHAAAAGRDVGVRDLAAAVTVPTGNTAELWDGPDARPPTGTAALWGEPDAQAPAGDPDAQPPTGTDGTTTDAAALSGEPGGQAPTGTDGPDRKFDRGARKVVEQTLQIAVRHRAPHIGTEHLVAALVHHGPPEVVAELAERGATAEAVDDLLARLDGGPGVEHLEAEPTPAEERKWRRFTGQQRKGFPYGTVLVVIAVAVALFVLCVWGP